ncbi:MAG: Pr6Pr family membrane protein [Aeromicrobium sp.]
MTRLWHGLIAVLASVALVGQAALTIDRDRSFANFLSYFTIESNILVLVTCVLLVQRPDRGGTAFGILRLGSLTSITVTGIVYATILAGNGDFQGIEWWYDKIFHYVVPAMSVIGFLVFRPRARLDRSALWFLVFPLVWIAYTLVRAEVVEPVFMLTPTQSAHVPYGFLDVADHGVATVTVICLVMTAAFVAIGAGYVWCSRRPASDGQAG